MSQPIGEKKMPVMNGILFPGCLAGGEGWRRDEEDGAVFIVVKTRAPR